MTHVGSGFSRIRHAFAGIAVALVAIAAALGCAEVGLRAANFTFQTFPTVQFGYPDPVTLHDLFVPDRDLFWVTKEYAATIAEAGRTHPAVVFMGDSCTQFGSYPGIVLTRVAETAPAVASGVKVGVAGWSSEQGRAQFTRDILPLHPRVVTLYYGWNDHWVALGAPDKDARPSEAVWWLAQHSRVWQLGMKARMSRPGRLDRRPYRVDIDRYIANLTMIVNLARDNGIGTVLITAPSGHEVGHEPAYLAERHLRRLSDLVPVHRNYVEATRTVAERTGATLCDAAAAFEADPDHASYFEKDGIHLNKAGNRALAAVVAPCVLRAAGAPDGEARR
jgi:lysophospholipase L1-like esterase